MKVLFAVSNDNISEAIVKKYQKQYKEIISYKNVYYFNAIQKEIQKDKSYDRIVISEDLEQFTNTSYEQMDKFIFDRLDNISDEASNMQGEDIPIILICTERRTKSEPILVKLFGIGIYNAIIGNDRSIDEVCRLINRPRSKKDAKTYYKIDSEDVDYKAENENDVSEVEIQNIIMHYKRLGKNEDKYVDSFNNIAAQYNDTQLRIISKFLPLNVRAVLEANSPKYQQVMSFNNAVSKDLRQKGKKKSKESESTGPSGKLLKSSNPKTPLSKPIVIPSEMNKNNAKRLTGSASSRLVPPDMTVMPPQATEEPAKNIEQTKPNIEETILPGLEAEVEHVEEPAPEPKPKRRGRPRKNPLPEEGKEEAKPKRRGRPKKVVEQTEEPVLPGLEETQNVEESILPGLDNLEEDNKFNEPILPGFEENVQEPVRHIEPVREYRTPVAPEPVQSSMVQTSEPKEIPNLNTLLTADKKVVAFVGTSKNGTSFAVNNVAELLSTNGINTAILDTTQNRNSYYIYTKNEEELRNIAYSSIEKLKNGIAQGIQVNKNLTVYTALPDENNNIENVGSILETLIKNHSLVLIDCDFETPKDYFANIQELYLVQSMDVLTIQPLTAFLRELKAKNILDEHKIRIVINKYTKIRGITEKTIIGGMAFYNDPSMSFMTELFDRNLVKYTILPFEEETYIKYLEGLINCNISLKGYSKMFLQGLKSLGNMVYPLIANKPSGKNSGYRPPEPARGSMFSQNMNDTLNQMKQNY